MKKIGIDARLVFQTGVGVYLRNLLYYLSKKTLPDLKIFVYVLTGDKDRLPFANKTWTIRETGAHWHSFNEQVEFLLKLNQDKLDLMHFTYFSFPILYHRPFIATVHDATPLLFKTGKASTKPSFFYEIKHAAFKLVLFQQIKNAQKIIVPTRFVGTQLTTLYKDSIKNKIQVTYEGVNYEILRAKPNLDLRKIYGEDFFLYVGNFYPHKNIETLILAMSDSQLDKKLILVGPADYFSKRFKQMIDRLGLENKIIIVHMASAGDLVYFYKYAGALVYPSRSEGFGLPLIEAAYFQLPIIASDIPVFKELLGRDYIAFDPESVESLTKELKNFISKQPKKNYGTTAERFSFEKMTDETLGIYRGLLSKNEQV